MPAGADLRVEGHGAFSPALRLAAVSGENGGGIEAVARDLSLGVLCVDENPYDSSSEWHSVRGFPIPLKYVQTWARKGASGVAARLKTWLRVHSSGADNKVHVFVKDQDDDGIPDYPSEKELDAIASGSGVPKEPEPEKEPEKEEDPVSEDEHERLNRMEEEILLTKELEKEELSKREFHQRKTPHAPKKETRAKAGAREWGEQMASFNAQIDDQLETKKREEDNSSDDDDDSEDLGLFSFSD